jgi:hypothetical protein
MPTSVCCFTDNVCNNNSACSSSKSQYTQDVRRENVDLNTDFTLTDTSWWKEPTLLVDPHFVSSWDISKKIQNCCPRVSLCCCYCLSCPDVDIGSSQEARIPLWRYLLPTCYNPTKTDAYVFDPEYPWLYNQYTIPPSMSGRHDPLANCPYLEDSQMEKDVPQRPPYRWVLIGVTGTGGRVHTDHAGTSAWNAVVTGRKRWVFFPPHTDGRLLETLEHGHPDERSDFWFLHKYHSVVERVFQETGVKPLEVMQTAGEVVYIPNGWWHVVRNEMFTVALTENFGIHPEGSGALYDAFGKWDKRSADIWWKWHTSTEVSRE